MTLPKYIDDLHKLPAGSLVVGNLATNDKDGFVTTSTSIEGTPSGFRALAEVLLKMANRVESPEIEKGWGLVLHPADIPGFETLDVKSLSIDCLVSTTRSFRDNGTQN